MTQPELYLLPLLDILGPSEQDSVHVRICSILHFNAGSRRSASDMSQTVTTCRRNPTLLQHFSVEVVFWFRSDSFGIFVSIRTDECDDSDFFAPNFCSYWFRKWVPRKSGFGERGRKARCRKESIETRAENVTTNIVIKSDGSITWRLPTYVFLAAGRGFESRSISVSIPNLLMAQHWPFV